MEAGDFNGALTSYAVLSAGLGTMLRYQFAGMAVEASLDEAACRKKLSQFRESSRLYERGLLNWGQNAGAFGVVRRAQADYAQL